MNLPVNKLFAQIAEWIWHLPPFGILLACAFLTSLGNTAQEPGDKSAAAESPPVSYQIGRCAPSVSGGGKLPGA